MMCGEIGIDKINIIPRISNAVPNKDDPVDPFLNGIGLGVNFELKYKQQNNTKPSKSHFDF